MGIMDKLTGGSSKSSSTSHAPTHGEKPTDLKGPNLVPEEEQSHTKVGSDKVTSNTHGVPGEQAEHVAAAAEAATGEGERVRTGDDTYDRKTNAPVVKETVRDEYQHNVQPVVQKEHDRTEIKPVVQPLKDNQVHDTQVHTKQRQDQFREVGQDEKLAAETEEKLRLDRERIAAQGGRQHEKDTHTFTENAPQVSHTERKHVIEEVQPVVERDVLRPHVVEEQQNVFIHHKEAPVLHETKVNPTMTVAEFERSQKSNDESQTFKPTK
jgi:hypothetical protein